MNSPAPSSATPDDKTSISRIELLDHALAMVDQIDVALGDPDYKIKMARLCAINVWAARLKDGPPHTEIAAMRMNEILLGFGDEYTEVQSALLALNCQSDAGAAS